MMVIPEGGQNVVIYFRNGIQIEGEVIGWTDEQSSIRTTKGDMIVIMNTLQDILFYKCQALRKTCDIRKKTYGESKEEYEEVKRKAVNGDVDIKDLAALKNELNDLEKEDVREKLNSHTSSGMRQVNYGQLPLQAIKVESPLQYSREESKRQNINISSGLSNLFPKKH